MPTAPPRTRSSTRRSTRPAERRQLREIARHVRVPADAVSSGWPAVQQKAVELGLGVDDWQADLGKIALSKRADGQYAAGIGGVVWSIPRQVGKTYLVALIVFALCLLNPRLTVLWTAHRAKTAAETFGKLQAFARRKKIGPHVLKVTVGSGDEVVYFRNGSRILFGARERGFGRGFDNVDIEVFDEAQILTEAAVEDMVPATNVARNPLLFFIGTPPRPKDPGEVFRQKRKDALKGDPDTAYAEFSADSDANEDDRKQWAKANPSYPKRTNEASMLRMKKNLNTPGSFRREGLGIWDEDQVASVIDPKVWGKLTALAPDGVPSYGVKFSPDGSSVALAVAVKHPTGVHVELVEHRPMGHGTSWLVDWLTERHDKAAQIVVDGRSGAAGLVNDLRAEKVPAKVIIAPDTNQAVAANVMLLEAVKRGTVTHFADPVLDESVRQAGHRAIGTAGGWGFKGLQGGDSTPVEAVALAHWAAKTSRRRPGQRTIGRVMA